MKNKEKKDIIFTQEKTVVSELEITEDLFKKIQEELNVEPKVSFGEFYQIIIGNKDSLDDYITYDYMQENYESGTSYDYYDDEPYEWECKPGLKRLKTYDIKEVIKEYFKHHNPEFSETSEEITEEKISVPERTLIEYYE